MLTNKTSDADYLYQFLLPFISINPSDNYRVREKLRGKEVGLHDLYTTTNREEFLEPVTIFHNKIIDYEHTNIPEDTRIKQFYVSLGIFDLDPKSATATITKNNKLELTWTESAGKGKFNTLIPPYLVATSAPTLSYEGGVLDIRVNVKSRSENDVVFVGKLESK